MFISSNIYTQTWEGSGASIAYAKITNDTISFNFQNSDQPLILICEILNTNTQFCKLVDEETYDFKYNVPVKVKQNLDTLQIYNHSTNKFENYINKKIRKLSHENLIETKIELFETSLSNHLIEEIIITQDSMLTINNLETKQFYTFKLTANEIDRVKETLNYFDYNGLNESLGWRNVCSGGDFGFTFTTIDKTKFSYTAMRIPEALKEFKELVYKLKEEKK